MDEKQIQELLAREDPIFALDIGTRSVIGVVGVRAGGLFKLLAVERQEHENRAMVDGQIEDIDQVAKVAGAVRARLEEKLGVSLRSVCVAAAGRALRTQQVTAEMELPTREPITAQQIYELEMQAVSQAFETMRRELPEEDAVVTCVGYSVIHYYLDGYALATLLGHRGKRIKADVIATFLPNEVVDSLYSAMEKNDLRVSNLTLEPIAAMNAIIPPELRMLNLALVDIGAGTSDIALSDEGSVTAYTMATVAGDEITETIVREYLVDFETAERIKKQLDSDKDVVTYQDILGFAYTISAKDVMRKVEPALDSLCAEICQRILDVNGKPPMAVFLVGGGSKMAGMCAMVARGLGVAENKVAVGGNNYIKRMVESELDISDPEYATPMGIAITAMLLEGQGGFMVTVNGKETRLLKQGNVTLIDVLLTCGFRYGQIMGRAGKSVTVELNGQKKTFHGGHPTLAVMEVNGQTAAVSTSVAPGDSIVFRPAVAGEGAAPVAGDLDPQWKQFEVFFNGERFWAGTMVWINGAEAAREQRILDGDKVEFYKIDTLLDLCQRTGLEPDGYAFYVNGQACALNYRLEAGDVVRCTTGLPSLPPEEPAEPEETVQEPDRDAPSVPGMTILLNGRPVTLKPKEDHSAYVFLDILNYVDIDLSNPQGEIVLLLNGAEASYLQTVREGDKIDVYWKERDSL